MSAENRFPVFMKSAAATLALATAVFCGLYRYTGIGAWLTATISFGTTCYHFAMRLLVGSLVPPINGSANWFRPKKWEAPLYHFLRVKTWKKHLPTYDPQQFSLRENTPEQVIQNMCSAEVVHEVIMLCSFLPLILVPLFGQFWVFFITSVLSALVDSLFVMAQRYNRPRIARIAEKSKK